METEWLETMEALWVWTGDENEDLAAVDQRRQWRLCGCGVETKLQTQRQWTGDDDGDLADGEWS